MKYLAIVLVLVAAIVISGCTSTTTTTTTTIPGEVTNGRLVMTVTDKAVNASTISHVYVTIDSVEIHNTTGNWTTLTTATQTYDLLQLKGQNFSAVLVDMNVGEANYDIVRLDISKVTVTDAVGDKDAKLPSGRLQINAQFTTRENQTAAVIFDFSVDESLHVTGNGLYIMTPVLNIRSYNRADVTSAGTGLVNINAISPVTSDKVSMDSDGNIGRGVQVSVDANVSINGNGKIILG